MSTSRRLLRWLLPPPKGRSDEKIVDARLSLVDDGSNSGWHQRGCVADVPAAGPSTFTHDGYREMLGQLASAGYRFRSFPEAEAALVEGFPFVLLRHDVDIELQPALKLAEIEAAQGIQSTFFFMIRTESYNVFSPAGSIAASRILALNHHLGLHFDCASYPPHASVAAFGMHGSSRPLPHGRGRSPMNWSLITGRDVFYTHLFQYRPGVDDGPIAGVWSFDINPFDTCHTLHFKNMVSMVQLCAELLPSLLDGTAVLTPQPADPPSYWPKRSAEDGAIFWEDRTVQVFNLIRGVTRPFPGAFTYLDNETARKIVIWRAAPFDTRLYWPASVPGEIVEVFYDGSFVVRTGDDALLVLESEGHSFTHADVGRHLGPAGTPRKTWQSPPS